MGKLIGAGILVVAAALAAGAGAWYKPWTSPDMLAWQAREKVKYAQIIHELIQATNSQLKLSALGPDDLAIPQQ